METIKKTMLILISSAYGLITGPRCHAQDTLQWTDGMKRDVQIRWETDRFVDMAAWQDVKRNRFRASRKKIEGIRFADGRVLDMHDPAFAKASEEARDKTMQRRVVRWVVAGVLSGITIYSIVKNAQGHGWLDLSHGQTSSSGSSYITWW